jgi:hypothetical protein
MGQGTRRAGRSLTWWRTRRNDHPEKEVTQMKRLLMAAAVLALLVGPASAFQCPLLIKQITDATAGKTDDASKKAQTLAAEAKALHDQGKHAESVAKAEEAAKAINLALKKK